MRIIAVDWSGAIKGARKKIHLAEVQGNTLCRIENGRNRQELIDHLIDLAATDARLALGLDFAFSFPSWFLDDRGYRSAPELWQACSAEGEGWLQACEPPFWGRPNRPCPRDLPTLLRRSEASIGAIAGIRPKSAFQVGGAGAVGTGSIRGMALLPRLAAAGFSIWPFSSSQLPLIIEIYPRVLTGAVNKSSRTDREDYMRRLYPVVTGTILNQAVANEDAFDAAVSALVMAAHVEAFKNLDSGDDATERLEGRIWQPATAARSEQSERAGPHELDS